MRESFKEVLLTKVGLVPEGRGGEVLVKERLFLKGSFGSGV